MKTVFLIAAAAACLAGPMPLRGGNLPTAPSFKPFSGMGYSPFAGTETPDNGDFPQYYPTIDQITFDLTNEVVFLANEITTYSMDGTLSNIAGICSAYNIKCYPCAYLSAANPADTAAQLNALMAVGNSNYSTTRGLVVGSEALLQGYDPQTLISNIYAVRAATGTNVPVGTREVPGYLLANPGVVAASDFVMADIYAYWAQVPITNAAAWTVQQWQQLTNAFPGKTVMIGEANWPTDGTNTMWSNPAVLPSVQNQGKFLADFVSMAASNNIEYFIFEFRDELWKVQEGVGTVEQNWGLLSTNNLKKQSLVDFLSTNFSLEIFPDAPRTSRVMIQTYEGNPYLLIGASNFPGNTPNTSTAFIGSPGTNQTSVTVTNIGPGNSWFFRASQNF